MNIDLEEAVSYRTPLSVSTNIRFPSGYTYPVCPRCKITLEREYQRYCDRCGQCLSWSKYNNAVTELWQPDK